MVSPAWEAVDFDTVRNSFVKAEIIDKNQISGEIGDEVEWSSAVSQRASAEAWKTRASRVILASEISAIHLILALVGTEAAEKINGGSYGENGSGCYGGNKGGSYGNNGGGSSNGSSAGYASSFIAATVAPAVTIAPMTAPSYASNTGSVGGNHGYSCLQVYQP
ncbi:hypothetical protein BV898_16391 [Hypsibius exemplaris]|uniref:Uncharacterized protein n=1 Tax=Hypsibius exemplaris TaxID=2072580 RepID=A0A9X6NFU3_HYPEX|nr:hypothetical protein BV898_16391 [Hypsibius exemplaris]